MQKHTIYLSSLLLSFSSVALFSQLAHANDELDEITVTTDFRATSIEDSTVSVSVISDEDFDKRGAEHLEETLNVAPNVNTSSGSSRSKYIQIRGIGERSQFRTPINPSVGLYIDGIDLSRSGGSATLFDINQVEVLRGPQGTQYGANALAGIINLSTNEPTNEKKGRIEGTIGNNGKQSLGVAVGGPLIKNTLLGRASLHGNKSDGFISNNFLNRDDTNNIDEVTARGHLKWLASDDVTVDLRYLHLDIDNGYDAFTLDNTRNSLADEPGKDTQKTNAFSLKSTWDVNPTVTLETSTSYSDSDLEYSYDEDWSYVGQFDDSLFPYSSFDQYLRSRKNKTFEARLLSNDEGRIFNDKSDWVLGIYFSDKSEDLQRKYTYLDTDFFSQYDTTNTAIYGQLDTEVNNKTTLITGLRVEQWDADYTDSDGFDINTDEVLYGGKLGLERELHDNHLGHVSLSRGYKAGGVNPDGTLPEENLDFGTEYQWNFEIGLNSSFLNDALATRLSAFYAKRKNQQVKRSFLTTRDDGSTDFTDYLDNAAKGTNYGLEAELDWKLSSKFNLKSSLGLLQTNFDEYPDSPELVDRDQAHAPNYQYMLGADYAFTPKVTGGLSLEGKDGFYFSDRHPVKTKSYNLLNANLKYKQGNFMTTLWGRNLTDKDYDVRGFGSFGNNPGNGYAVETYTQKGEPRTFGLTVSYDFD